MKSVAGSVGDTVMPASYHICVPAFTGVPTWVQVSPPLVVFHTPRMPLVDAFANIAYSVSGSLGATASSSRPRPFVTLGVPLPVPAGNPLLSSVHDATAGQPFVGSVVRYTPFAPLLARSGCTGVARPRVTTPAYRYVVPERFTASKPVMSWRWLVKPFV